MAKVRMVESDVERDAAQLHSLLTLLHGHGFDAFESSLPKDRGNLLWLASDLACRVHAAINGGGHER